jgi:large subunit ribosomal protein L22
MEVFASSKSVRVAPRKVRLVADAIRKLSIEDALKALSILKNRGGGPLEKVLKSAIANALNNKNLKQEELKIKMIDVLEAPAYKRFHPSTRGRVHPYKRKGSHIKIVLETKVVQKVIDSKVSQDEKGEEK